MACREAAGVLPRRARVLPIQGTVLSRLSGRLLLRAAAAFLKDQLDRGVAHDLVVVMDGHRVRWCRNVFRRLRGRVGVRSAVVAVERIGAAGGWEDFRRMVNDTMTGSHARALAASSGPHVVVIEHGRVVSSR